MEPIKLLEELTEANRSRSEEATPSTAVKGSTRNGLSRFDAAKSTAGRRSTATSHALELRLSIASAFDSAAKIAKNDAVVDVEEPERIVSTTASNCFVEAGSAGVKKVTFAADANGASTDIETLRIGRVPPRDAISLQRRSSVHKIETKDDVDVCERMGKIAHRAATTRMRNGEERRIVVRECRVACLPNHTPEELLKWLLLL